MQPTEVTTRDLQLVDEPSSFGVRPVRATNLTACLRASQDCVQITCLSNTDEVAQILIVKLARVGPIKMLFLTLTLATRAAILTHSRTAGSAPQAACLGEERRGQGVLCCLWCVLPVMIVISAFLHRSTPSGIQQRVCHTSTTPTTHCATPHSRSLPIGPRARYSLLFLSSHNLHLHMSWCSSPSSAPMSTRRHTIPRLAQVCSI